LPLADAFAWFIALHISLAGLGMYALGALTLALGSPLYLALEVRWLSRVALGLGAIALGSVLLSLLMAEPFLKLAERLVTDPAWAARAFGQAGVHIAMAVPSPRMFWGYESQGLIRLGLVALACAAVLALLRRRPRIGALGAIGLVWLDL
jgi:hypothetical protein